MSGVSSHVPARVWLAMRCVALLLAAGTPAYSGGNTDELTCGILPVDPLGGCFNWETLHDGDSLGDDGPTDVAVSPDGSRVFVVGFSYTRPPADTRYDYTILSYDAQTGEELWYETYSGPDESGAPGGGDDFAMAVALSPDGDSVYVTGTSHGYFAQHGESATGTTTLAFDADSGEMQWEAREIGPGLGTDVGRDVVVNEDGSRVFVVSTIWGDGNQDVGMYAYDADSGALVWDRAYNGPGDGHDSMFFRSLAISPDDASVYVSAQSYSGPGSGYDYAVLAYNTQDGSSQWEGRWDGGEGNVDRAFSLDVAPDGSKVFVTGRSRLADSGYDYGTVAFDADSGGPVWEARYDGAGLRDEAFTVKASPDGSRVFVTGYSDGGETTGRDYATVAYDADSGDELWATRYDGVAGGTDAATTIAVDPGSLQVYVTGRSAGASGALDMVTVAYQADTGVAVWTSTYNGPAQGDDMGVAMTVSPDGGSVYVAGDSYVGPASSFDIVTVSIDAGGFGFLPELPELPDPPV